MLVRDFMSDFVITVTPQDSLKTALERTQWAGRHIPVVENGALVGIITDRDIRLAVNSPFIFRERLQDEALLTETMVAVCMTPNPLTISENAPLYEAAALMVEHKISGLPVLAEPLGQLIGVITTTDLLKALILFTQETI
jgi:acetoin utilization protein AcuB